MKKNIQINIANTLFNIDEDAYEMLSNYLDKMRYALNLGDESEEVFHDIEMRISELLQARLTDFKKVIVLEDVKYVIEEMGEVEDIAEENIEEKNNKKEKKRENPRRLFRDGENKVIGGVASGIAAFFDIDPVWIRVAFILMTIFGFFGILIYIILYICVPEARTASDRLKMKGEKVTAENIAKNISDEFNSVKNDFKSWSKKNKRTKNNSEKSIFIRILAFIWRLAVCVIASVTIVCCIYFLIITFMVIFTDFTMSGSPITPIEYLSLPQLAFTICRNDFWAIATIISLAILLIIPCFQILMFSVSILLNINLKNKLFNKTAAIVCIISLIFFLVSACMHTFFYSNTDSVKFEKNITAKSEIVDININAIGEQSLNFKECDRYHNLLGYEKDEEHKTIACPNIKLHQSDSTIKVSAEIKRRGQLNNFVNPASVFSVDSNSINLLCLPYITSEQCFTSLVYNIYLPENTTLHLNDNAKYIFRMRALISDAEMASSIFTFSEGELRTKVEKE